MDIGAIITKRETDTIRKRLNKIDKLTSDRRINEQCRMIACDINRAARRAARKTQDTKLF